MLDRLVSAVVALSLASLVWLYMRSRDQEILDNVPVPVQISLAPAQEDLYECEVTGASQVPVSFTGPPARIRELRNLLQHGELRIGIGLTVPAERLGESRYLETVRIDANDIHPPQGITPLVTEGRNRISVILYRLTERRLPVRFDHTASERFAQVMLDPASVLVRGPQEILDQARAIPTQPYSPPTQADTAATPSIWTAESVPLVQEIKGRRIHATPSTVSARLTLQPQQRTYELSDVPVQFLCPANFALRPVFGDERAGKITLRLSGPTGEDAPALVAFVDLTGRKWEPGLYEEPLKLQLPKDFQLAQSPPRSVAFQLIPTDTGPKTAGVATGR
jgi:hypothetical protein